MTIPKFGGRPVDGARLTFAGSHDDNDTILDVDQEVVLVIQGRVTSVAHKTNQFGVLRRVHSVTVDHAIPADPESRDAIQREIKRVADEESGQESLDEEIDGA